MSVRRRILVVDDSALSREALKAALESDGQLEVAGMASSGEESLELAERLKPDLITMDLQMPGMGGLKAIERHVRARPTPIVVISERSSTGAVDLNYEALSRGALELIPKSSLFGASDDGLARFVEHLKLLIEGSHAPAQTPSTGAADGLKLAAQAPLLMGVGASTGGPRALSRLLAGLPKDFPLPVVVVQHMAEDFFESFVRFLADSSALTVQLATAGLKLRAGLIAVAPPRQELFVKDTLEVKLVPPPANALISPTVDSLFFSMASSLKERALGVLLTGMGDDGAQGLLRMRRAGARTLAQDRASSAVWGMPGAAAALGAAEAVVSLDDLPRVVTRLARAREVKEGPRSGAFLALRKRVVVVDDDPVALADTRRQLEQAGYEVVALDNPFLVATTLRKQPADLLVLEPELKTTSGEVVINALRTHTAAQIPLLLCSGLSEADLKAQMKTCGAIGGVSKGPQGAELRAAVEKLIGGPRRA